MPRLRPLPTRNRARSPKLLARRKIECSNLAVRLTTERKVFAGVLGLAVVALGVDRLFLGGGATGPAAANAEPTPVAAATPSAPVTAPAPGAGLVAGAVTTIPVAKQLAALQSITRDADAFVPPSRWQQALDEAAAAEAASHRGAAAKAAPAQVDEATIRFQRNQLTAILIEDRAQGRIAKALIKVAPDEHRAAASRLYSIGDELDGYRLVRIDAASVEFEPVGGDKAGSNVTLGLPVPFEPRGIAGR